MWAQTHIHWCFKHMHWCSYHMRAQKHMHWCIEHVDANSAICAHLNWEGSKKLLKTYGLRFQTYEL